MNKLVPSDVRTTTAHEDDNEHDDEQEYVADASLSMKPPESN